MAPETGPFFWDDGRGPSPGTNAVGGCCRFLRPRNAKMPTLPGTRRRRDMTMLAGLRRRIQKFGPYQSLALLAVPLACAEPLKLLALYVAGGGHWLTGTGMMIGAYAAS